MHTNGPWQATRSDSAEGYDVWWITASPNGHNSEKEICSVSGREEGNARLIAAAPTLLDLLKRAREELRLIRMKDCGVIYDVLIRLEMDMAIFNITGD
jgi:hypothetical protein